MAEVQYTLRQFCLDAEKRGFLQSLEGTFPYEDDDPNKFKFYKVRTAPGDFYAAQDLETLKTYILERSGPEDGEKIMSLIEPAYESDRVIDTPFDPGYLDEWLWELSMQGANYLI